MDNQSAITLEIKEKLLNAKQFIIDNQNLYQETTTLNATQLVNLFKQSILFENEIFQQMQKVLQTIDVNNSNQSGNVINLDNALRVIEHYKSILADHDKFQQEITKRYQNLANDNDKNLFMSSMLNCDLSDSNTKLYDNLLKKIQYQESTRKTGNLTFAPITSATDPNKISFETDLLKLISTKTGLAQLKDINQKLDKLNKSQSGTLKISFRDDKDSMSYSQNSKDIEYNKEAVEEFNSKYENDIPVYIHNVSSGMPSKFIVQPSELPEGRMQTVLYPKTGAREKVAIKIGEKDGAACICVSPRIASFSHELGHMQRAMQGQFEKNLPVPNMFEQTYDNLEEFYTVLLENQLLAELGLPPRITHGGTIIDPNKLNDQTYISTLDSSMLLFLCKGNFVLGNLKNIFADVKENVAMHAQKLTSQMNSLTNTTSETIKDKLEAEVNPKSVLTSSNIITTNLKEDTVSEIHNIIMQNLNLSPNIQQAVLNVIKDCESTKIGGLSTERVISKLKQYMLDSIPKDLIKKYVDDAIDQTTPNRKQVIEDITYNIKREYEKFLEKKVVADLIGDEMKTVNMDKIIDSLKQEFNSNLCNLYAHNLKLPLVSQSTSTLHKEGWQSSSSNEKFVQIAVEHKETVKPKESTQSEPQIGTTTPSVITPSTQNDQVTPNRRGGYHS